LIKDVEAAIGCKCSEYLAKHKILVKNHQDNIANTLGTTFEKLTKISHEFRSKDFPSIAIVTKEFYKDMAKKVLVECIDQYSDSNMYRLLTLFPDENNMINQIDNKDGYDQFKKHVVETEDAIGFKINDFDYSQAVNYQVELMTRTLRKVTYFSNHPVPSEFIPRGDDIDEMKLDAIKKKRLLTKWINENNVKGSMHFKDSDAIMIFNDMARYPNKQINNSNIHRFCMNWVDEKDYIYNGLNGQIQITNTWTDLVNFIENKHLHEYKTIAHKYNEKIKKQLASDQYFATYHGPLSEFTEIENESIQDIEKRFDVAFTNLVQFMNDNTCKGSQYFTKPFPIELFAKITRYPQKVPNGKQFINMLTNNVDKLKNLDLSNWSDIVSFINENMDLGLCERYCNECKREFKCPRGLQMHLQDSQAHCRRI
jgi:hypothetical protein